MKYILLGLLAGLFLVFLVQGSGETVRNKIFRRPILLSPTTNNRFLQYRQSFIDTLYILMQNSIELSIHEVQLMQTKIEENFNQVFDGIFETQKSANDILTQILSDYERLFPSDNRHPCVPKDTQLMNNITSNGQNVVMKCIETAIGEVDNIRDSVTPYIESINSSMKLINKVAEQCSRSSNKIAIGICVVENVEVVANTVTSINHDINEADRLASIQMYVVGENAQSCIQSSLNSTKKEVEDVVAVANRCATAKY